MPFTVVITLIPSIPARILDGDGVTREVEEIVTKDIVVKERLGA